MRRLMFALLFVAGCATLEDAERIVWSVYAVKDCAPPKVDFEVPSTCPHGWINDGVCIEGWRRGNDVSFIADGRALHETAFAHEVLHSAIACKQHGDGDAGHTRAEWQTDLPAANKKLEEIGK